MRINVAEAKNKLASLIRAVEDGSAVTICRRGEPVVDLVRTRQSSRRKTKRKLGTLRGKIVLLDQDWSKAMNNAEADKFLEGGLR